MKREMIIRFVAGILVLFGTAMGYFVSVVWFLLPAFVGANLLQSSLTGFCPLEEVLRRMGK